MSIYLSPLEEDVMDDYKKKEDLGKCPKCRKLGCKCDPETCDCVPANPEQVRKLAVALSKSNLIRCKE